MHINAEGEAPRDPSPPPPKPETPWEACPRSLSLVLVCYHMLEFLLVQKNPVVIPTMQ